MGPLTYSEDDGEVFLGRSVTQQKNVSDETAHAIDAEIRSIIDKNYTRAKDILVEKMDILHAMSDALMKYETIDSEQIASLMEGKEPGPPANWDEPDSDLPSGPSAGATADDAGSDKPSTGPVGGPASQH